MAGKKSRTILHKGLLPGRKVDRKTIEESVRENRVVTKISAQIKTLKDCIVKFFSVM
jgi:hypothetical protein